MHGNEVVGREMTVELMVQLCDAYLASNQNVMDLIQATRIHLLATMNPDGWDNAVNAEFKEFGKKYSSAEEMLKAQGICLFYETGIKAKCYLYENLVYVLFFIC